MSCYSSAAQMGLALCCQLTCCYCSSHPHKTFATIHESVQKQSTGHFSLWVISRPAGWLSFLQTDFLITLWCLQQLWWLVVRTTWTNGEQVSQEVVQIQQWPNPSWVWCPVTLYNTRSLLSWVMTVKPKSWTKWTQWTFYGHSAGVAGRLPANGKCFTC